MVLKWYEVIQLWYVKRWYGYDMIMIWLWCDIINPIPLVLACASVSSWSRCSVSWSMDLRRAALSIFSSCRPLLPFKAASKPCHMRGTQDGENKINKELLVSGPVILWRRVHGMGWNYLEWDGMEHVLCLPSWSWLPALPADSCPHSATCPRNPTH